MISLLFIMLISLASPTHDVPLAIFKFYEVDNKLHLDITIDANDLIEQIQMRKSVFSKSILQSYFTKKLQLIVNDRVCGFEIQSFHQQADHLLIKAYFPDTCSDISFLRIVNTCLIDVTAQSNVIELDINGTTRDFRMHRGRQQISVEY